MRSGCCSPAAGRRRGWSSPPDRHRAARRLLRPQQARGLRWAPASPPSSGRRRPRGGRRRRRGDAEPPLSRAAARDQPDRPVPLARPRGVRRRRQAHSHDRELTASTKVSSASSPASSSTTADPTRCTALLSRRGVLPRGGATPLPTLAGRPDRRLNGAPGRLFADGGRRRRTRGTVRSRCTGGRSRGRPRGCCGCSPHRRRGTAGTGPPRRAPASAVPVPAAPRCRPGPC